MTTVGKIIGTIWALPVTLIGLILAFTAGVEDVCVTNWTLQFEVKKLWFTKSTIIGFTMGSVVMVEHGNWNNERLLSHEHVHVRQCWTLGILVIVVYLLLSLSTFMMGARAYKDNPMECQAQKLSKK